MNRKPQVGDLIQKADGTVGMLIERFELHERQKIASRNYRPAWFWHIKFFSKAEEDPPENFYGVSEESLMAGLHGRILL